MPVGHKLEQDFDLTQRRADVLYAAFVKTEGVTEVEKSESKTLTSKTKKSRK